MVTPSEWHSFKLLEASYSLWFAKLLDIKGQVSVTFYMHRFVSNLVLSYLIDLMVGVRFNF